MNAQQDPHKYNLVYLKAFPLFIGSITVVTLLPRLLWPEIVDAQVGDGFQNNNSWYSTLGMCLVVSGVALGTFRWMHLRVRRVLASELGLLIISNPIKAVVWSEVSSVKKTLNGLLGGFYLISLSDGTKTYAPIERELPDIAAVLAACVTLRDLDDKPTVLEQLCRKNGVWIEQWHRKGGIWTR